MRVRPRIPRYRVTNTYTEPLERRRDDDKAASKTNSKAGGTLLTPHAPASSPTWVKSRRCDTNACLEAADLGNVVAVRNSTQPGGPVVEFTKDEWKAFIGGVEDGDFRFS